MTANGTLIRRLRIAAAAADPSFPQTGRDFAAMIGINASVLSKIERGDTPNPTPRSLRLIAQGLKVDVRSIMRFEDVA